MATGEVQEQQMTIALIQVGKQYVVGVLHPFQVQLADVQRLPQHAYVRGKNGAMIVSIIPVGVNNLLQEGTSVFTAVVPTMMRTLFSPALERVNSLFGLQLPGPP